MRDEFEQLLQALHTAGVKFVLVGGLAMVAHGAVTLTGDVDICYARDPENLEWSRSQRPLALLGIGQDGIYCENEQKQNDA